MRTIIVNKISLEQHNRLIDMGYKVRYVQQAPTASPYVNYKYESPKAVSNVRPKRISRSVSLHVCTKNHVKEEG